MGTSRAAYGAVIASAATIACGALFYLFAPGRIAELFALPLIPGCIIGYLFVYGDSSNDSDIAWAITVISMPIYAALGAFVGAAFEPCEPTSEPEPCGAIHGQKRL